MGFRLKRNIAIPLTTPAGRENVIHIRRECCVPSRSEPHGVTLKVSILPASMVGAPDNRRRSYIVKAKLAQIRHWGSESNTATSEVGVFIECDGLALGKNGKQASKKKKGFDDSHNDVLCGLLKYVLVDDLPGIRKVQINLRLI